ncbi:hypothetical protein BO82DRAFT_351113 [Aspergillus uvarum CBS 121591]|uniref:DUF4246 domain-containing protein n=1 Tax=Aspergillus uvarum CBS 121591 TaxID=1448315 RepID=A0A319CHI2_9EURO|nr:hypothetical protein BO82DRAFT_351113 [Aspergillus uvarum CBS 121591]PYH85246.1 hypothetical protein BO82DRAFT_351113 [Aspergillus uvarum CBS 121591]
MDVNIQDTFSHDRLQVVVKMTHIELTPERPSYAGESWHIDGQLECKNFLSQPCISHRPHVPAGAKVVPH